MLTQAALERSTVRAQGNRPQNVSNSTVAWQPFLTAFQGEFNGSLQHRVQSIGGAFEAQGLSRTLIQTQGNLVEVDLGED